MWQPIETAPRDGENHILLCNAASGEISVGYWVGGKWPWRIFDSAQPDGTNEWSEDGPTHWMPLPAPPTTSQG